MDDIVDLVSRSDGELRELIARFEKEEREISRKHRILHAKIDILRAELVMRLQQGREEGQSLISTNDLDRLTQILAGRGPGAREAGPLDAAVDAGAPPSSGTTADADEDSQEGSVGSAGGA
ncbi:MAG: hypothetical protein FJ000_02240 [Actinobacteria bacterium]|nr:hypothetical protein [Actinomycetota bacterium]